LDPHWLFVGFHRNRSTPLPWLPVLANIEPPALRRKVTTDRLVTKVLLHDRWSIHHAILNQPQQRLTSRKPLWCATTPTDIKSQWRESWKSAPVVKAHLVDDSTIWQPGFTLPRQQWSLPFPYTGQGHCGACRKTWRLTDTNLCPCGETQTMFHIVKSYHFTKLNGGLSQLHSTDAAAIAIANYES